MDILVVIDMQNDFITDALGTPEAPNIVDSVCGLIRSFDGQVVYTRDTHFEDYLNTQEGKKLPVEHCIKGTDGWQICKKVSECIGEEDLIVDKVTFGAEQLPNLLRKRMKREYTADDMAMSAERVKSENSEGSAENNENAVADMIPEEIHLAGLCTDICVISNAMICKAAFPETLIYIHEACCAGVTPESHRTALDAMRACQMEIV